VQNFGGQNALKAATENVQSQAAPAQSGPVQTQADASQVFQGTQYAKDASKLGNALWQPVGGEQATFEQSPWQGITDRATTKANDLFLGLAGARGSAISGNTARGLQENAANINDSMYGNYLNAYNNAATNNYNASTNAFDKWMSGLGGVADTGYSADQTIAGNSVNQGNTLANLAAGNGQARAEGIQNASNSTQNALGGVFNAIGQGVQAFNTPQTAPTQQPKTNALYTGQNQQSAAPVRIRNMLNPSIIKAA
jgi:hypothetical protein